MAQCEYGIICPREPFADEIGDLGNQQEDLRRQAEQQRKLGYPQLAESYDEEAHQIQKLMEQKLKYINKEYPPCKNCKVP